MSWWLDNEHDMWRFSLRKDTCARSFLKLILFAVSLLLPWTLHAQDPTPSPNPGVYGKEVYVPKPSEQKAPEEDAMSFSDGFLRNARHHFGFSLGVTETYTPNVFITPQATRALVTTSLSPLLYANFQNKRFNLRLNYGASYNRYNRDAGEFSSLSQNGSASTGYVFSRRKITLNFSNFFTSAHYDPGSSLATALGAYQYQ